MRPLMRRCRYTNEPNMAVTDFALLRFAMMAAAGGCLVQQMCLLSHHDKADGKWFRLSDC